MAKIFNVTGLCIPEKHYMVNIENRLAEIKKLVDEGLYFTINKARQYGKTTTLKALQDHLQNEYYVIFMDFQTFGSAEFEQEHCFALSFADDFLYLLGENNLSVNITKSLSTVLSNMKTCIVSESTTYRLRRLFKDLKEICKITDKPIVLMIDEIDSAANNQVFLDFLAQLRAAYLEKNRQAAFHSVILAGVCDIKNLKRKLRPEDEHKVNSPWNIAADFNVNMELSKSGIAGMLCAYENDWHTDMHIDKIAGLLYDYTSGYPFLVSRLCKLMDEEVSGIQNGNKKRLGWSKKQAWTTAGFHEAVRMILEEKNALFESLIGKLTDFPELNGMLQSLLFTGKPIIYNPDDLAIDVAGMFGFIKNQNGTAVIANRIFETRLYNFYLSTAENQKLDIYKISLQDRSQFIVNGYLDMRRVLEKFVEHFHELYGDRDKNFVEEEGRRYFLLYLQPIINGTGNYYIESRTRELGRTDIIVDYHGEQYIIEMKIWNGQEYNQRGEKQLARYLDDYHKKKGYMLSFNFNQKKKIGVKEVMVGDKVLIEATV